MRQGPPDSRQPGGDQRLLTFLLLSISIFLFSQMIFGPPAQPPAPEPVAEADQQGAEEDADDVSAPGGAAEAGADPQAPPFEADPEAPPQLVAIGSAETDGPARMLLTADNRGAAVRRVELSASKFRDLDDRRGYLGELELEETGDGGLRVRVVGAGTPAEEAGIEPGDVFPDAAALREQLASLEAGGVLSTSVVRDGQTVAVEAALTRRPLMILRPESENVRLHTPDIADEITDTPSFLVSIAELNGLDADDAPIIAANKELTTGTWRVASSGASSVTFRKRLAGLGLEFEKRFELAETPAEKADDRTFPSYHFRLEVGVRNLLAKPQKVAYQIDGPNGLPIEGWWYANRIGRSESGNGVWFRQIGIRDVVARYAESPFIQWQCSSIVNDDVEPMGQGAPLRYLGVDAQYFSVVMMPLTESPDESWFDVARAKLATAELPDKGPNKCKPTYNNTTFEAVRKPVELAAAGGGGDRRVDPFLVFAGPKRPDLLEQDAYAPNGNRDYGLSNVLYYGWFGFVSRPMLWLLHFFYGVVGNYGVAIVMLTVLVRGAMFPLSRKQAMNMVMMQQLKPEMDRIAAKYKDDMQKRGQAQQELFRKHNYNPMGGCVLMLFQLPIFIGLYRALAVDIELRQAPLLSESIQFCSNLGAPDAFYDWSWLMPRWFNNGDGVLALGPYLNILPIVTICLFLLQQKMFMPPPANEQAEMQQKMMKYMMIFFGVMFFKVPSGLCLYFIASSLWGITERKLLPKPQPPADAGFSKPSEAPKPKPKPSGGEAAAQRKKQQRQAAAKKNKKKR